ncbi:MAG: hypothetical protein V1690_00340 [Candidatus Moraniibacteriota bacterium]
MLKKIIKCFIKPQLSKEAFFAYFHRLPDKIQVKWKKENGFIIGTITDGDKIYHTQGKGAEDFVDMVNDAVYTMHEVPEEYYESLSQCRAYDPNKSEKNRLGLKDVRRSSFSIKKELIST